MVKSINYKEINMKVIKYLLPLLALTSLLFSCSTEHQLDHIDPNAPAPAQIKNVRVEETPGGALLKYTLPDDPNIAYVKAVYEIQPGVFREGKSSFYVDTLSLVGFGDTLSHEVRLYSVGKNEKASNPLIIKVTPKQPPVKSVFSTVDLNAAFGGLRVSFKNTTQAKLALVVMVDSLNNNIWSPVTTFYTEAPQGNFYARGFNPTEKKFAVFVRDRWNNKSDTLQKSLTPMLEQLIVKPFANVALPTDTYDYVEVFSLDKLWDNSLAPNTAVFATKGTAPMPQWFTLDLKKKVVLSRFKEFQRQGYEYAGFCVKTFEIWGSNAPDQDGGWNNWQLLGSFESFKPSGPGTITPEDRAYASFNGEDFDFETQPPAVRYIRFKTTSTYGSAGQVCIAELTFWGQPIE